MQAASLSDLHASLHAALAAQLFDLLVALVERDAARARDLLTQFCAAVEGHARVEEEEVLPVLEEHARAAGITEGPGLPSHITPEHRLLERTSAELTAALGALDAAPTARAIVDVLPLAYRLQGIYEHHTERELRLYPALDATARADALKRALLRAP
jgi:hypothetical protein